MKDPIIVKCTCGKTYYQCSYHYNVLTTKYEKKIEIDRLDKIFIKGENVPAHVGFNCECGNHAVHETPSELSQWVKTNWTFL